LLNILSAPVHSSHKGLADAVPTVFTPEPFPHVGHVAHAASRWPSVSRYALSPQLEHVRLAVLESAEIFWPLLHVACAAHVIWRWPSVSRYVL
jgi:hypothetical protein